MRPNYNVLGSSGAYDRGHLSLVSAAIAAREAAAQHPGVEYQVERADGTVQATYQLAAGQMKAWVR